MARLERQQAPADWQKLRTTLPDGKIVSTVHLGINHAYTDGPDLWYETMVFPEEENYSELACRRYTTAAEARTGHAAMVDEWTPTFPDLGEGAR